MNNNALIKFLNDIYSDTIKTLLTSQEIKSIEKFYNTNFKKFTNINDFYNEDKNISKLIKKVKSVRCEVERQFDLNYGLQSGTLCECVLAETIAHLYGFDKFADVFHTYIRDLPANILYKLRDDNNRILCRYIYYNENDTNSFLIQYGNPTRYDADLYLDNEIVKIEFKDKIARAGEKETKYDDFGKLIYDQDFSLNNPDYIPLIDEFNKNNSIIDLEGNYKIIDKEISKKMLQSYFRNLGFEVLVSLDENKLVAITEECINPDNGLEFISLEGSEIRRAGKNSYPVFTEAYLVQSIQNISGTINGNIVEIPIGKMENRKNKDVISGKKINPLFYVRLENIKVCRDKYVFDIKNVKQLKPTICVHMQIISDRKQLVSFYDEMLNKD